MDQMLTIALVVFGCAIMVFFSKEFGNSIKKIFSIPGMKLLLPLILVSFFIIFFKFEVLWFLTKLQAFLFALVQNLSSLLPFQNIDYPLANILVLMGLSALPVLAINLWYKRKTYHPYKYIGLTMTVIWLFVAVLLSYGLLGLDLNQRISLAHLIL